MHRHEHHVSRLEPDVVARIPVQQVIVQVERRQRLAGAPHLDRAHVGALRHTARGIEPRQHRAERADLVGARLRHLAHDVHLVRAHVGDGDVEPRARARRALHTGIHPAEARVQHVAQLVEGEIRDEHLPNLRDQDEPLAGHLERVRQLHVARQDQHQHVTGPELVVGGNGTRQQGEELRRGAPKHVHAEHGAAGPRRGSHDAGIDREDLPGGRDRRKPERLDRGELARPGHGCRLAGGGGAEVGVEQICRVAARLEPRSDLLPRQPRLQDALADHVPQPGVLLQRLLQCRLGLARWRHVLSVGAG